MVPSKQHVIYRLMAGGGAGRPKLTETDEERLP